MRKYLAVLATFAVAFNLVYVFNKHLDSLLILAKPKAGPAVQMPRVRPEVIERVKRTTVLISNEGFGGVGRGTGVLISRVHVLTCAHLIQSWEDDLYLYLHDGTFVRGKPMAGDKAKDLAIILLDKPVRVPYVVEFTDKVVDGEPIAIVGNSLGAMKWYVSGGVISGRHKDWLLTDAFQIGGNSGGPWVNAKGEVIALAAWGLHTNKGIRTGVNGGIGVPLIRKFLDEVRNPKPLLQFIIGG